MNVNEIGKAGVVGGVVAIVVEFIIGLAFVGSASVIYDFGFVAMILGGFVAGWMIKTKHEDAVVAGVVAGLIYVILGLFVIFPLVAGYHSASPLAAIIIGIVLGAIGGFVGNYIAGGQGGSKRSGRK